MTATTPGEFIKRGKGPGRPAISVRATRLTLFALAVIGALAGLGVLWLHVTSDPLADARAYYDAARRLNAGLALYPSGANPDTADFYRYPPLLAIVLRPLALLPFHVFALLWESVVVAAFVVLVQRLGVRRERTWIAIGLLGIPIGWALAIAQAHVPVTLLLAVGQPWSIALAANLKLFPVLAAVWWIGRREWGALAALAGWLIILALAQALVEPASAKAFLDTLTLEQVGDVRNISPYAVDPLLWAILFAAGFIGAVIAAPTRAGWPAAAALASLAYPRLLVYMLMGLLAAIREPDEPVEGPEALLRAAQAPPADAAEAYVRSAR